jgi:hypothetical protein
VRLFSALCCAVVLAHGCQCDEPLADLTGIIDVDPRVLDLGTVRTIVAHETSVTVGNRGTGSLSLLEVAVEPADGPFRLVAAPTSVRPGEALPVALTLQVEGPGAVTGTLVIQSDDPATPRLEVPLLAEGGVARLFVSPDPISFGRVNEGAGAARTVTLANDGLDDLIIDSIGFVDDADFDLDATALGTLPRRLLPAESALVTVSLTPSAQTIVDNGGADLGDLLRIGTNVGPTDVVVTATVNLAPVTIAVEQRSRRHVVKAGVSDIVFVDGSDTADPEGDAFTFGWSVSERPTTSVTTIIGQGQPVVRVTPDVVGRYLVRLRATDVHGAFAEDTVEILPRDLGVVLSWSPAPDAPCRAFSEAQCAAFTPNERRQRCCGQSDLDLHLVAPGGALGDYGSCPATCPTVDFCAEESDEHVDDCRSTGLDCAFANRSPEWAARGRFDDPSLDIDDVGGDGPEVISLNDPADGTYRVVVHYCQDRIGEPSLATVSLFDQGIPLQVTSPQPIVAGQAWLAAVLVRSAGAWQVIAQPGIFESTIPADLCTR